MTDQQVARIVPAAFYFQGQSAPTQMRNATAMRLGEDRHVIAGLVDTTGYAADVRAKYEGFLITDLPITINGEALEIGAYGFGFSNDGKFSVMNIAGDQLLSVATTKDNALKRPRPLMMAESDSGIRLYSGKDYVVIAAK
jgi:surfactin synthase thioesterase subunit